MNSNEVLKEVDISTMYERLYDTLYTNIVGFVFSLIVLIVLFYYLYKQKNNLYR